jgi:hypothetical protein
MPTFNEVAAFKAVLQRKALVGVILTADYSVPAIADLVDATGALTIPVGYDSSGKLTNDGVEFSDEITKAEQRGWGDSYPSRIDVTQEAASLNFSAMETNRVVLQNFHNVDIPTTPTTANSIVVDKAPLPEIKDKRVVGLFRDINKRTGADIYMGIEFPKGNISQNGSQTYNNDEGGLVYPMTAQAQLDDVEGTAVRLMWGGPGLADLLADMGFTVA